MNLTIRDALVTIFVGMSLLSLGVILFESSNYDNYYWQGRSAILDSGSNNTRVNGVKITKDITTGAIHVRISVSATNPTNYLGFTLEAFDLNLFFVHAGNVNQSLFESLDQQLLANTRLDRPLNPTSTVSTDLLLTLDSTQSSSYQMFNRTYSGNIDAIVVVLTVFNSFMDPVSGPMTTLKQQEIPVQ
jgi:hypothetical protein